MFSPAQKREIAAAVEAVILSFGHPEMPTEKPNFKLHVDGAESWSWADIIPNWKYDQELVTPKVPTHLVYAIKAKTVAVDDDSVAVGTFPSGQFSKQGTLDEVEAWLETIGYILCKGQKADDLLEKYPDLVKALADHGADQLPDLQHAFSVSE